MKPILLIALAALLAGQACLATAANEPSNKSKLETLKGEIASLKEQLFSHNSEIDKVEATLQEKEQQLANVRQQIASLEQEIIALNGEMDSLAERKGALDALKAQQQAEVAKELSSAYRQGNAEAIKVLLNQEDPHKIARILKYHHYFAEARRQKIEAFASTIDEVIAVEQDIQAKQAAIEENRDAQLAAADALALEQQGRQQALAQLQSLVDNDQAQLDKLNTERKGLEELIARLEENLLSIGKEFTIPFGKKRGKMPWPVNGKVAKGFGSQRAQSIQWTGWLLDTPEGEPVSTVHQGRVVFSDYLRGQGLMIIVDHGDGYLSLYAHNQVLLKEVGDWVQTGDRLALSGTTGGLENSALYFEIRHNGTPQDPKRWLVSRR